MTDESDSDQSGEADNVAKDGFHRLHVTISRAFTCGRLSRHYQG